MELEEGEILSDSDHDDPTLAEIAEESPLKPTNRLSATTYFTEFDEDENAIFVRGASPPFRQCVYRAPSAMPRMYPDNGFWRNDYWQNRRKSKISKRYRKKPQRWFKNRVWIKDSLKRGVLEEVDHNTMLTDR
jgi:hypothetical protein